MQDTPFHFDAPAYTVTKSYRGENGEMYIEGIASTVDIDQTGEPMSPEVIPRMAARLIVCPLREEHQKGYLNRLEAIVKADVVNDSNNRPALWIKAKRHDWSSSAKDTFQAITSGIKLGLSVAGRIKPGGLVKQLDESLGKYIPTYIDVERTELSVTDHPANLATSALAVTKSMPEGFMQQEVVIAADTPVLTLNGLKEALSALSKAEHKPDEVKDVATADFLDPTHFAHPVHAQHLMPALRAFNRAGQRKGVAVAMEKTFEQAEDAVFTSDPDVVAKMQKDTAVGYTVLHMYRSTGQLPKG